MFSQNTNPEANVELPPTLSAGALRVRRYREKRKRIAAQIDDGLITAGGEELVTVSESSNNMTTNSEANVELPPTLSAGALRNRRYLEKRKRIDAHIATQIDDGLITGEELEILMKAKSNRIEAAKDRRKELKRERAKESNEKESVGVLAASQPSLPPPPPQHQVNYNLLRKRLRKELALLPETEERAAARIAYNQQRRKNLQALPLEERRRKYTPLTKLAQKQARRRTRALLVLKKKVALLEAILQQVQTEANGLYATNQFIRKIFNTSDETMIAYLVGPLCNLDSIVVDRMDKVERLGLFIQLKRVNEIYDDQRRVNRKRDNNSDRSAHIISHFQRITQSFNEAAVNTALKIFFKKAAREDGGASSKLSLTMAINQQSFRSCNLTGYQTIADSMNRNEASGDGIMPSRNAVQECGNEIAEGTKAVVAPIVDEVHHVYRVNLVDELLNICNAEYVRRDLSLSAELISPHLDSTYICAEEWRGCVVKLNTSNKHLMAYIGSRAIDLNHSCDGFELASSSNGGVGVIITFKGRAILRYLNKDYDIQKDNPEYGDRAGCHSINSVLFQALGIGADDYEMSKLLTEVSFKLVQELHRPGRLFYHKELDLYFYFKNSITVDKKEGNQITATGGGTYMTNFFDIYTDDNQETKGFMSWRQCDDCYQKGRRIYGTKWTHFSHHNHDYSDYCRAVDDFSSAARDRRANQAVQAKVDAGENGGARISRIKSEDRTFKAAEKMYIFESPLYHDLDNVLGPCHHHDVIEEDERLMWKSLPADDWRRTTIFSGMIVKGKSRAEIENTLLNIFEIPAEDLICTRKALENHVADQYSKKYVPMTKVMNLCETEGLDNGEELSDYNKLVINERMHGINDADCTQRLYDLAIELNITTQEVYNGLPNEIARRKFILLFAKFIANRIEYCNVRHSHEPLVTRIEMLVPCGLHNNIRVPCNLLTHLRKVIDGRADMTVVQRKLLGEKLEETISKSIGSGTNSKFNYTYKGSMLQVVSLSGVKLINVMDNWASLVNVVFSDLDTPENLLLKMKWTDLGERFADCIMLLNYKFDMTASEVTRFQLCMDLFCSRYRDVIAINAETNYIQNMSAGVFRYFARAYGSIYAYNNTAMEACAGREQNFFQHGTQHDVDGHRGKSLIEAFLDHHMVGRAILMDQLAPGSLDTTISTGKSNRNEIRNEKDARRRLDQKDKQVNGINIVADRKVRAGYYDDTCKLCFKDVILQIGDPMPEKARKPSTDSIILGKKIAKRLKLTASNE